MESRPDLRPLQLLRSLHRSFLLLELYLVADSQLKRSQLPIVPVPDAFLEANQNDILIVLGGGGQFPAAPKCTAFEP